MKNSAKALLLGIVFSFLVASPVSAQYDTEQITPVYREDGEVYGIDIAASDRVSFFPTGCESIDKVTIEAKNAIKGEIILRKLDENPKPDAGEIDNVFEYCELEFDGIDADDIQSTEVELKVRKSWIEDNNLSEDDIALFTFNEDDNTWSRENTAQKTESSIYFFYDSEAGNFPYWAVGQRSESFLSSINAGVILLCCIVSLLLLILLAFALAARRRGNA
ncbi:MAG: hypothetical protein TR69_WS6001000825 [candidate division WS6 bacterium OLB20]|uniref:PGF-pre-PGF domain-containing protein n=1 Tax=candidate division WS6 bacterium OLB20 TaxID=1617426 RepID=A0A136LYQ4_9BACT|nr:MAG: hypothetical protein TR69_WS6001000825 [candidate division WS6 bacterium OLB20]